MSLSEKQKRHLRGLGHGLKPVVIVGGGGLSEGVLEELDTSLEHHELMKVRVNAVDREDRDAMIAALCEASRAQLVQRIGHIALLYRPARPPKLKIPKA